jgi:hemoglobin
MAQAVSTPVTRRSVVAGLSLTVASLAVLARADNAYALEKQTMPEKSLYERLGGVFAIAAVVDHFSDAVVKNPIVGQKSKNPQLREWHTKNLGRLPGLKFMRTLWVCDVSGGPFKFTATKPGTTPLGLEEAHRDLRISPAEFDEVAAELGRTLDFFKVPKAEKGEVLAAFAAHKGEVTAGYVAAAKGG